MAVMMVAVMTVVVVMMMMIRLRLLLRRRRRYHVHWSRVDASRGRRGLAPRHGRRRSLSMLLVEDSARIRDHRRRFVVRGRCRRVRPILFQLRVVHVRAARRVERVVHWCHWLRPDRSNFHC